MHILEIPSFFPPHGGLFCLEQARALKARGHEVRILSCTNLGVMRDGGFYLVARRDFWQENMDGVHILGHYQHDIPKLVYVNTVRWLRAVANMYSAYKKMFGRPDVLHAHCCKLAGIAASEIARREDIPYFITEHLPSELYTKDFGMGWTRHHWLKTLMQRAYHDATCVIPVSRELVDDVAPLFGRDYRYQEISNIIDTNYYAFRPRHRIVGRPFRYCCLAIADIHRKGYDVLAKAWTDMENVELHIAGRGTDGAELSALFAESDNVICYGHLEREKVRDLLYYCDALVLPSRSEAQPLVILEALSTGIPVVTTECAPQSERIPDACLIAPRDDANKLREQMLAVQQKRPSSSFHDAVCALASPDVVAQQLEKLFLGN